MKKNLLICAAGLMLLGCGKKFGPALEQSERAFAEKNYTGVIDTLNAALPRWKESDGDEKKGEAYQLLGKSYHALKNTDKAIEAFQQAVKSSDKTYEAAYGLGMIYVGRNQPDPAENYFLEALRMKPDDPAALLGLGNSYFIAKKNEDARLAFEKVLDVSPGVRDAMESLAHIKSPPKKKSAVKAAAKKRKPAAKTHQRKRRS